MISFFGYIMPGKTGVELIACYQDTKQDHYLPDHTGIIMQNDVEVPVARAMRRELLGRFVMPYNTKGMNASNRETL